MKRTDLLKHFATGMIMGLTACGVWLMVTFGILVFYGSLTWFIVIVTFLSSLVFFGKEVWDVHKPKPTGFDWLDIAAGYVGLAWGFIVGLKFIINL